MEYVAPVFAVADMHAEESTVTIPKLQTAENIAEIHETSMLFEKKTARDHCHRR